MSSAQPGKVFQPLEADDPKAVGTYRLAARLGAGGMGKVYLSYTPAGRPVAIKVIRPEFAEDPEFRRRFKQEVIAAQRVHGLHTAPVIDSDADGAQPWLATAFVSGPTVAAAVAEHGPLPVPTVLLMVAGIAEALQAVHAAGIVHRDLKPSNVLLAADGPRVIDFGIARAADATALTDSGITIGTPAFMSPEQAAGRTITPATDVFALGQVAAYAALGAPAYGEGSSHAVLYRIVHEEPELSALPAELRPLVAACLAKDPDQRPSLQDVVSMCQSASDQTQLVRPEQWLPVAVAADLSARHAAPTYAPQPSTPQPSTPQPSEPGPHPATEAPATPSAGTPATPPPYSPTVRAAAEPVGPPPVQPPLHQPPTQQRPSVQQQPQQYQHQPVQPQFQQPMPQQHYAQGPGGGHPFAPLPLPPKKKSKALIVVGVVGALLAIGLVSSLVKGLTGNSDASKNNSTGPTTSSSSQSSAGQTSGGVSTGTDSSTGSAQPTTKPPAPKPTAFPKVQLADRYHLEFADETLQPHESNNDDFYYLCDFTGCNFGAYKTTLVLLEPGEKGSLDTCLTESRYATQIPQARLSAGSQICARTKTGIVALLTYKHASSESDPSKNVVLEVQLWRNAIPETD